MANSTAERRSCYTWIQAATRAATKVIAQIPALATTCECCSIRRAVRGSLEQLVRLPSSGHTTK